MLILCAWLFGYYVPLHIFIIVLINFDAFTSKAQNFCVYTSNEIRAKWQKKNESRIFLSYTHIHAQPRHMHTWIDARTQKAMEIIQVTLSNIFFWKRWDRPESGRKTVAQKSERAHENDRVIYRFCRHNTNSLRNSQIYEIVGIRKHLGFTALH